MVVNSKETRATLALMEPLKGRNNLVQISRNGVTFTVGMYGLYHTAVIKSSPGTEGPNAATQKLIRALGVVKPGFVISVGVGYGINRRKLQMADIIVANIVQDYTYRRIGTESDVIRSPQFPVGARLLDVFDQTAGFKLMRGPDDPVKVKIDPIISGPNLVDSLEEKNKLTAYFPDAEGGEMEGAGIMFAVQSVPNNKPEAIVIKAIVDWADGTKEKSWQPFAAHASASYVLYHMKTRALKGLKPGLLLPSALARGSEWGSLYTYVRTYRNMSRSGTLILQPCETDQWTSARCSRACRAGAATYGVKQSTSVYTATPQ